MSDRVRSTTSAHHRQRLDRLEHALDGGPAQTAALAARLFGDVEAPTDQLLAEMETYAHLEHLRLRGHVALVEPGVWAVEQTG